MKKRSAETQLYDEHDYSVVRDKWEEAKDFVVELSEMSPEDFDKWIRALQFGGEFGSRIFAVIDDELYKEREMCDDVRSIIGLGVYCVTNRPYGIEVIPQKYAPEILRICNRFNTIEKAVFAELDKL